MAEESKGVALAILGIVAVIAVVGLVMLFTGATGRLSEGGPGNPKLYTRESMQGYAGGPANVENPYYGYNYETQVLRPDVGDYTAAGGNWGEVYGESDYPAAVQPGMNVAPGATHAATDDRDPVSIPSGQTSPCGVCPYGSVCQADAGRVPGNWEPVSGYPGCYVVTAHD